MLIFSYISLPSCQQEISILFNLPQGKGGRQKCNDKKNEQVGILAFGFWLMDGKTQGDIDQSGIKVGIGNMIRIINYNLKGFVLSILNQFCVLTTPPSTQLLSQWHDDEAGDPSKRGFPHLLHYHSPVLNLRLANQTLEIVLTWHPHGILLIDDFTRP